MSCQEFEPVLVEIARERLLDAVARQRALAHTENCAACAAVLAEERALQSGLRGLAAAVAGEAAPIRLEDALRAAFRQQAVTPVNAPAQPFAPGRRGWWLALAALLLLTLGVFGARWLGFSANSEQRLVQSAPSAATPTPELLSPQLLSMEPRTPVKIEDGPVAPAPPRGRVEVSKGRRPNRAAQMARSVLPNVIPAEYVTEFFPVTRGGELIPLEGGQILRVQMPRSNLIPLGIPVNQERATETVKADVLVSHDGLARAIRLVY